MGDPKKIRSRFSGPSHPWERGRMEEETEIRKSYGLHRKHEIWKLNSLLRDYKKQAKRLAALTTMQAEKEKIQLLKKLHRYGLIAETAQLSDVLSLTIKDLMERRLQTMVFKKQLARSLLQARQFIVHEHINIGERKITSPSYLVELREEPLISFAQGSALGSAEHPERVALLHPKKEKKKVVKFDRRRRPQRRAHG